METTICSNSVSYHRKFDTLSGVAFEIWLAGVAQVFQPAGSRNFPVPCFPKLATGKSLISRDKNVPPTRRQECCFVEKILHAREHRRLISLSFVVDGGEGRGEEALLKIPSPWPSPRASLRGEGNEFMTLEMVSTVQQECLRYHVLEIRG
ncbi:MAG TPA: hypothetical protein VJT54_06930, partial [Verrucomicrobiae bacterium]|nr:hypothetical protein [Verrucomicrobiae bacterium]